MIFSSLCRSTFFVLSDRATMISTKKEGALGGGTLAPTPMR